MPSPPDLPPCTAPAPPATDRPDVAKVRHAIAAGTYRVDPERLAEALLAAGVLDPRRTP